MNKELIYSFELRAYLHSTSPRRVKTSLIEKLCCGETGFKNQKTVSVSVAAGFQ